MKPISLSIFFPAYNEALNIRESVERTVRVAEESPYVNEYEILIINDGSKDNSVEVATQLMAEFPAVRLVNHSKNKGLTASGNRRIV